MKFGREFFLYMLSDTQTYRQAHCNTLHPNQGRSNKT